MGDIKACFERMVSHNVLRAILVVRKEMNRFASSAITDANSKGILYLESFKVSEKVYAASLFVSRNILL